MTAGCGLLAIGIIALAARVREWSARLVRDIAMWFLVLFLIVMVVAPVLGVIAVLTELTKLNWG